eukprot:jgi/Chrzof1/12895/Cz07g11120.t1
MATEVCGFITIVGGTFLLHTTKDMHLTVSDLDQLTRSDDSKTGTGSALGTAASLRERRWGNGNTSLTLEMMSSKANAGYGLGVVDADDFQDDDPLLPISTMTIMNGNNTGFAGRKAGRNAA